MVMAHYSFSLLQCHNRGTRYPDTLHHVAPFFVIPSEPTRWYWHGFLVSIETDDRALDLPCEMVIADT